MRQCRVLVRLVASYYGLLNAGQCIRLTDDVASVFFSAVKKIAENGECDTEDACCGVDAGARATS